MYLVLRAVVNGQALQFVYRICENLSPDNRGRRDGYRTIVIKEWTHLLRQRFAAGYGGGFRLLSEFPLKLTLEPKPKVPRVQRVGLYVTISRNRRVRLTVGRVEELRVLFCKANQA